MLTPTASIQRKVRKVTSTLPCYNRRKGNKCGPWRTSTQPCARPPPASVPARSNHRLRAVHVGLVAAPGGAPRRKGQPRGARLVVQGRSERPAQVWVGLAVQGVEAGAGAQVDGVALARVAKVGVAVVARRVQRPVQEPRHWVLVLGLARGTLGAR